MFLNKFFFKLVMKDIVIIYRNFLLVVLLVGCILLFFVGEGFGS